MTLVFLAGSTGHCSVFDWQQAWVVVYYIAISLVPYNATEVAQGPSDNSNESINGRVRAPRRGPIVVEPDDHLGPTDEEPARRFYQWAPQFYWHLEAPSIVDEGARRAMEQILGDAFKFG